MRCGVRYTAASWRAATGKYLVSCFCKRSLYRKTKYLTAGSPRTGDFLVLFLRLKKLRCGTRTGKYSGYSCTGVFVSPAGDFSMASRHGQVFGGRVRLFLFLLRGISRLTLEMTSVYDGELPRASIGKVVFLLRLPLGGAVAQRLMRGRFRKPSRRRVAAGI